MSSLLRRWLVVALVLVAVISVACGDDDGSEPDAMPVETAAPFGGLTPGAAVPTPYFDEGTATLSGADAGEILVRVQLAETPDQQSIGLMGRTDLPADAGMVFIFPGEYEGGFWMKNTLIPLSIAFIREGVIVDILDMVPCDAEPCEIYTPDSPYDTALEVNAGSFTEWGIEEGDTVKISD